MHTPERLNRDEEIRLAAFDRALSSWAGARPDVSSVIEEAAQIEKFIKEGKENG